MTDVNAMPDETRPGVSQPTGKSAGCPELRGILVTAGSSGGITALKIMLASLPSDFPLPVVVVQHRAPVPPYHLAEILSRHTTLPIRMAESRERLDAGTVYIVPHDLHATLVERGVIELRDTRRIKFVSSSANPLFESTAVEFGAQAIAVVFSGYGSDGTDGVQAIKRHGGVVVAQGAVTSQVFGMPRAAIETGMVDYVLPAAEIGPLVTRLARELPARCGDETQPSPGPASVFLPRSAERGSLPRPGVHPLLLQMHERP
jgi:two-component system chemotaxis response regulator CheB